jgi:hypothetical protein
MNDLGVTLGMGLERSVGAGLSTNAVKNMGAVALAVNMTASGAVVGAVFGALAKDSIGAAAVGGLIGAVVGGAFGGYLGYETKQAASS